MKDTGRLERSFGSLRPFEGEERRRHTPFALQGQGVSQTQIDRIVALDPALQNVEFSVAPRLNRTLVDKGMTTRGINIRTQVDIGPSSFRNRDELVNTLVHEELHVRIFERALRGRQSDINRVMNESLEESHVQRAVERFLGRHGLQYEP